MVGVTLGVAVLIIVISVMTGFDHEIREKIIGFNPHINVTQSEHTIRNYEAIINTISSNPAVRIAAPFVLGRVMAETEPPSGQGMFEAPVMRGIVPKLEPQVSILPKSIIDGEFNLRNRGVLIGSVFASRMHLNVGDRLLLYSPEQLKEMKENAGKEGSKVTLAPEFTVRGIFDVGYFEYDVSFIVTSLDDAQELYAIDDTVHGILVMLNNPDQAAQIKEQLAQELGPGFKLETWMETNETLLGAVAAEKNVMFILLFFIMIVAALCILSAIIVFVVQKTREIGMLKALGATDLQVSGLFLSQSAFVGAVGVSVGFGLAMLLLAYRNEFLHFMRSVTGLELFPAAIYNFTELPALIVPGDVILICGSAFVICVLGGVIPAWRAGRLKPVEALRYE